MRVLVAGGSGLIGHELASTLIGNGDEVTILSRNPTGVRGMPSQVRILPWDGKTIQAWAEEIEHCQAVVNLTGENLSGKGVFPSRWTAERKARLLTSRVNSGRVLATAFEQAGRKPAVFVQASGMNYYGMDRPEALTEADSAGDDFLARLSVDWEASSAAVEAMGVRRVIIRNGIVLSTKGGALRPLLLQFRLFAGGPLGSGRQVYSWIHIGDEVGAINFLLHNDRAMGVYNLTAPNPVTNAEFGRTISKVMKRPYYFPIPGFMMQLVFGEVASLVLQGETVLPARLLEQGYTFKFPLLADALRDLL
ncbi:MAG: TIGR01777 family oxidoreductase [Acidobacteriaceae bacterium]